MDDPKNKKSKSQTDSSIDLSNARPDRVAQEFGPPNAPPLELPNEQLFRSLSRSTVDILWFFLSAYGTGNPCYIKAKEIEEHTGVSLSSVKRGLKCLADHSLLVKKHYRNQADQGMEIELMPSCNEYRLYLRAYPLRSPLTRGPSERPEIVSIDREDISSLPSDISAVHTMGNEAFKESFPYVHKIDFFPFMFAELAIKRMKKGEDCSHLVQGLRYIDYALEHDLLKTTNGDTIKKPVNCASPRN